MRWKLSESRGDPWECSVSTRGSATADGDTMRIAAKKMSMRSRGWGHLHNRRRGLAS
jgi:hypothetical protein